jgi:hypothetical protein
MLNLPPQSDSKDDAGSLRRGGAITGLPRWVYVSGIIVIVMVVLLAILHIEGGGLGGHTP